MIHERIETVRQKLKNWFAKAQKTFPKPNTGQNPTVSDKCQSDLRGILSGLDSVLARLKAEKQDGLYNKLQGAIERQNIFLCDIGNSEEPTDYLTDLHNSLIAVLSECYDYFAPVETLKKPTRAEVESLIKNLLDFENEQPEFITGIFPDNDRKINPVEKLRLARYADIFKKLCPDDKRVFENFAQAIGNNSLQGTLLTMPIMLATLCDLRNTMPEQLDETQKVNDAYIPFGKAICFSNGILTRKKLEKAIDKSIPLKVHDKKPSKRRRLVHIQDVILLIDKLFLNENAKEEAAKMFGEYAACLQKNHKQNTNLD